MRLACTLLIAVLATGCISDHCAGCDGACSETLAAQEQRIADLEQDWVTLRDAVETLQSALNGLQPASGGFTKGSDLLDNPPPPIYAKVSAVDAKLNIVVLSVGKAEGVKPGFIFTIHRGNEYVGRVVVDDVQQECCSGYSKVELQAKPIEVGDDARSRWETSEPETDGGGK